MMEAGRNTKLPRGGNARRIVIVGPTRDNTQILKLNIQKGFHRSRGTDRLRSSSPFDVNHLAVASGPAKTFVAMSPYHADPAAVPLVMRRREHYRRQPAVHAMYAVPELEKGITWLLDANWGFALWTQNAALVPTGVLLHLGDPSEEASLVCFEGTMTGLGPSGIRVV